jgi:hypothetical protein
MSIVVAPAVGLSALGFVAACFTSEAWLYGLGV